MGPKKMQVRIWEEDITIPTYETGQPDKNPMFIEKRVYQGSSGKVYPYPVIDKIYDEKKDKTYRAVFLENEYLIVVVLPELGGRIQYATDKTNGYDFVYRNDVIKPALVGLTGPWISGGIEFNWPQHHRPTTFSPVDYILCENEDGSKTVRISETDQMYGTKGMASFTLHPDKAYIEIKGQLYNPTAMPQTFLWWANPAVAVNDYTQSIFPPDVHAVMDHGKRAVSEFPIATGTYYKHDYSEGVDISRYKNIPVPTSYMAYHSDFNFVGGYDYNEKAGILHIADHHVSPGKKQWTWGCGDFGKAWDRNLTDENGPYIELMTGMFTDNQPDFTWLKPFEEKTFTQYFMPYKHAGNVKNASTEVVLNLEVEGEKANVCVYATAVYENSKILLQTSGKTIFETIAKISPVEIFTDEVPINKCQAQELTLSVYDEKGRLMLSYTPSDLLKNVAIPEPAQPAEEPEQIATIEELYLTGLHIEQYRHATYEPDAYYLEGLKRDPGDSRINTAYGTLLLRRGLFSESEKFFRKAIERATWKNPNPYNSEPYFYLGLSLLYQGNDEKAFDAFYKATWTCAEQEMSFYYLATISARQGDFKNSLEFVERSLIKNSRNIRARGLKAVLLRLLGKNEQAKTWLSENIAVDPFDYLSRLESGDTDTALRLMRDNANTFIAAASEYASYGCYGEAVETLNLCNCDSPMLKYYEALYLSLNNDEKAATSALKEAANRNSLYCFPNKLEDIAVLQFAITNNAKDAKALYYLGNLWYDKKQYSKSLSLWEQSAQIDGKFPTVWRNLALIYFNKERQEHKAQTALETAFTLDNSDARVFLELDQLYKKLGKTPIERIANYNANEETFRKRDDLWVEYITLLNLLGRYDEAYEQTMKHKFHTWEGGEGKITAQYTLSLVAMARVALCKNDAATAKNLLLEALILPENLGEGKLEGAKDNNVYYYLGNAEEMLGETENAKRNWQLATLGETEPAGAMFYNDQPADMILYQGLAFKKLDQLEQANQRFQTLIKYGEVHIADTVKIDYFAVSLPDLQLFDEDLNMRNKIHCHYLIALGSYGLGNSKLAQLQCEETLRLDSAHTGAAMHYPLFKL